MNVVYKTMIFCRFTGPIQLFSPEWAAGVLDSYQRAEHEAKRNAEQGRGTETRTKNGTVLQVRIRFYIKNEGFCITNDGLCIENDGFCISNDAGKFGTEHAPTDVGLHRY